MIWWIDQCAILVRSSDNWHEPLLCRLACLLFAACDVSDFATSEVGRAQALPARCVCAVRRL